MPKLEIKCQGDVKLVDFNRPRLTIGRQAGNDIVLSDPAASRRHCVLQRVGGNFLLKDLESHNGTWIGENRIIEASLNLGDTLRIGATFIRLVPDELEEIESEDRPEAEVIVEEEDEKVAPIPRAAVDRSGVVTDLAVRQMVAGPLARQLGPLMQACVHVPLPDGAPQVAREIRLLTRRGGRITLDKDAKSKPAEAAEALRQLLFAAFRTRATDIHIEPKAEVYALRFRIDGLLHAVGEVTAKMGVAILNVIKVLCEMDIAKRNIVQEGGFAAELPTRRVDFRVNMTPTMYGQKLALRFLDKAAVPTQFENLGMDLDNAAELARICAQDSGMVILAGPTGSGKTTTLYAALQSIDASTRNVVTIEDPVEYELQGTTQISIDPVHNVTFSSVLASVLRQDPDVILVGEIRDKDTARMAMQAATTGHLVFTTIHARDTVGTIFRILDLGVEPFLVANAITMCITQRLVRTLCPNCKRPYRPDAKTIRRLSLDGRPHGDLYEAVGCRKCMGTGYRGRMALFETLLFTPQVRDVILTSPTISDIRKAAGEWMFNTLTAAGYRKVIEGVTTVQEVDRVATMT